MAKVMTGGLRFYLRLAEDIIFLLVDLQEFFFQI